MLRDAFGEESVVVRAADAPVARADLLDAARGADALLTMLSESVDAEVMDTAGQQLKVIANYAVGYNNIDVDAATQRGIVVTNTPDVLTDATADLAWTLLMAAARRAGEGERMVRAGDWDGWGPQQLRGVDVWGATLGVFGMGRIGQAVARRAKGFDMRVLYHNRHRVDEALERELGATWVPKATLIAEADFLSLNCPLTDETRHAIGAAEFEAMKPTAVLINTARGPVVDEAALARALKAGALFAAGLDVFEEEPAVHPDLMACENAVLLPHLGSATFSTRSRMAEMAAANTIAALRGQTPPNAVNAEAVGG
jgi:glyoxylate reductase